MEIHKQMAFEKSRRNITEIIVHCTATPAGRRVSVADIDSWHRQRGFNGIGYHYVVELDGHIAQGRPVHLAGAHCKGHNSNSIGVVYVGGLDADGRAADTRTAAQRNALITRVRDKNFMIFNQAKDNIEYWAAFQGRLIYLYSLVLLIPEDKLPV